MNRKYPFVQGYFRQSLENSNSAKKKEQYSSSLADPASQFEEQKSKWKKSAWPLEFVLSFLQIPSMEASGRSTITAFLFTRSMELHSLILLMLSVFNFHYHYQFRLLPKFYLIFYTFDFVFFLLFQIMHSMNLARIRVFMRFSLRISFALLSMASTVSKFNSDYFYLISFQFHFFNTHMYYFFNFNY